MLLSERLYNDFLREDPRTESVHKVSHGYLVDLIIDIQQMEERFQDIHEKAMLLKRNLEQLDVR